MKTSYFVDENKLFWSAKQVKLMRKTTCFAIGHFPLKPIPPTHEIVTRLNPNRYQAIRSGSVDFLWGIISSCLAVPGIRGDVVAARMGGG
jgi:hypothetical protein